MFVKPGIGSDGKPLMVRGPDRVRLPEAGAHRPETSFWHRRVTHGDVVLADPPTQPTAPKPAADGAAS